MTDRPPLPYAHFPEVPTFAVTSSDVRDGEQLTNNQVFNAMGYSGENRSPQLAWSGAPEGTKSFAITIFDPDAPTGSGFWHWVVFDIPEQVQELASGAGEIGGTPVPSARQARNDGGSVGYMGAAPPPGDSPHRYVHTVHALDVERLEVGGDPSPAYVGFNLRFHALARAQLVAHFGSER